MVYFHYVKPISLMRVHFTELTVQTFQWSRIIVFFVVYYTINPYALINNRTELNISDVFFSELILMFSVRIWWGRLGDRQYSVKIWTINHDAVDNGLQPPYVWFMLVNLELIFSKYVKTLPNKLSRGELSEKTERQREMAHQPIGFHYFKFDIF